MSAPVRTSCDFGCIVAGNKGSQVFVFPHYDFLFAEIGHPIHGKPLYANSPSNLAEHQRRQLGELNVLELKTKHTSQGDEVVTDDVLVQLAHAHFPEVVSTASHAFGANYVAVEHELTERAVTPKDCLNSCIQQSELLDRVVKYLTSTFPIAVHSLGITGSSLISRQASSNDHDLVIYSKPSESVAVERVLGGIRAEPSWRAPAFGIDWPHRFKHPDLGTICLFFAYEERADCPINLAGFEVLSSEKPFSASIVDDRYSAYSPSLYRCKNNEFEWLIVLGTAARGLFRRGYVIDGLALPVSIKIEDRLSKCLMVSYPFKQIRQLRLQAA